MRHIPLPATFVAFAFLATAIGAASAPNVPPPEVLVRSLYATYLDGADGSGSPFVDDGVRARVFSRALVAALVADEVAAEGEVGALGFDPIIDGQDYELHDVQLATERLEEGQAATVVATFTNLDHPSVLRYALVWEDGGWRVDDIVATSDPSWGLRALLTEAAAGY
jgi:hypothetical protein